MQNGEHSFSSKRRHGEEKSFHGHSFLLERRVQSHRFSGRLAYGEGISERNPLPRLINIVVVRRQVGLLRTDRPPLTLSSVSFYSDDGFQPMQKELYNNNDKKTE